MRHAECIVPNMFIIPSIREPGTTLKRRERGTELSWAVPVDNENVHTLAVYRTKGVTILRRKNFAEACLCKDAMTGAVCFDLGFNDMKHAVLRNAKQASLLE